jgi:DNA ligase D-like protein (predicted ligase)
MKKYKPMLAESARAPFTSKEWIFEVKWDGIRAISYINQTFSIRSRNQKELKDNFPELEELRHLTKNAVLDGEIIVMKEGRPDFQVLLERKQKTSRKDIEYLSKRFPATYVVFDILEKDGTPLLDLPLIERKRILEKFVKEGEHIVLSLFVDEIGEAYFEAAIARGFEGIMAKKKESPYRPGMRSSEWLKIKKTKSCDCVIFGYTKGEKSRGETFGALILGLYDGDTPIYVGKVGTGFSEENLEKLKTIFKPIEADAEVLHEVDISEEITWLKPKLVCEVRYQSITKDGKLRMPRFYRMRFDKSPKECTIKQIRE